jgi:CBS domain-containing protein
MEGEHMDVGKICKRRAVTIGSHADLVEAARLMREAHVGFLVVNDGGQPRGVLTDRDIVLEAVACGISPEEVTVGDAMTTDPVTLTEDTALEDALECLRTAGIRRAPVVDDGGRTTGVLSLDDVLDYLADQLWSVAGSLRHEQAIERIARP